MESSQLKWFLQNHKHRQTFLHWSLLLFIFLIPFQTHLLLVSMDTGKGLLNTFASFFLTLPEIVLGLSVLLSIGGAPKPAPQKLDPFEQKSLSLFEKWAGATTLWILGLIAWKSSEQEGLFTALSWIKGLEPLLIYFIYKKSQLSPQKCWTALLYSAELQIFFALAQGWQGGSLGLHFLGEPHLSGVNVAKWEFFDQIRGYGTFAHPNILATWIGLAIIGLSQKVQEQMHHGFSRELLAHLGFLVMGLLLTGSRTASFLIIVLTLALLFFNREKWGSGLKIKLFAFLPLFIGFVAALASAYFRSTGGTGENTFNRWQSLELGWELFQTKMWTGVGLFKSTSLLDTVASQPLMPWHYQPAHNTPLLVATELGLPTLIALSITGFYFLKTSTKSPFLKSAVFIFFLGLSFTDHFLYSLDVGRQMLSLGLSLALLPSTPDPNLDAPLENLKPLS